MAKESKKAGAGGGGGGGQAAAAASSAAAASANAASAESEFKIPRKKKRPAPPTTPSSAKNDDEKLKAPGDAAAAAGASNRTSASGPSRKRSRTTPSHGTSRNTMGGGGNSKAANSKQSEKAKAGAGKRAKTQSGPGSRPATDRGNAHASKKGGSGKRKAAATAMNRNTCTATGGHIEGNDGGVLLGHRILKPFPHVRRMKRGKKYVEEDCEALFLGTVVKYHRPADADASGEGGGGADSSSGNRGRGRGRPAQVLVAKRIASDGTRTDKDLVYRDDKGPLDVGLYRVRFDDGDVSDLEPTEIYAGAVLYQKERAKRLAAGGGGGGGGGDLAIIVGCCVVVAPHHKHQPSEERGVKSLLGFANPPMDYGAASGRRIVAALDEEMQAYWEAYESFHREEGIKRPPLLSRRAKRSRKSVGWGWDEGEDNEGEGGSGSDDDDGGGADDDGAASISTSSSMTEKRNDNSADAAEASVPPSSASIGEDDEDSVDGGSTSHGHVRAEERVMSQDLLPKELREEDHAVVIVEGPRKRKKTAAYSDTTPEDPACWNSLVRAHDSSDDGGAGDGAGDSSTSGRRRRSAPLSIAKLHLLSKVAVGCRISILWPDDNEYYPGKVTGRDPESNRIFRVMYDDGECETLDLGKEKFRILKGKKKSKKKRKVSSTSDHEGEDFDGDGDGDGVECPFCAKSFKKTSGLSSHLNTCKMKEEIEAEIEGAINTVAGSGDDSNRDGNRPLDSKDQDRDERLKTKKKVKSKPRKPERRRMASTNKITPQAIIQDGKLMAMRASMPRKRKQTKPYTDDSPVDEACAEALSKHHHSSDDEEDIYSSSEDEQIQRGGGVKGAMIGKKSLPSMSNRDDESDDSSNDSESAFTNQASSVAGEDTNSADDVKQKKMHPRISVIPSDDSLRRSMKSLIFEVDLNTLTSRQFISKLSESLGGIDLTSKKAFIKETLTNMVIDMDVGGVKSKSAAAAPNGASAEARQRGRKGPPSLGKQPRFQHNVSKDGADADSNGGGEVEDHSSDAVEGSSSVSQQPRQRDVKWMSVRYFSESGETDSDDEEDQGEETGDEHSGQSSLSANPVADGKSTASRGSGEINDINEEKKEEVDATRITGKDVASGSNGGEESGLEDRVGVNATASATEPGPSSPSEQIRTADDKDKESTSTPSSAKSTASVTHGTPSPGRLDTAASDDADASEAAAKLAELVQDEVASAVETKDGPLVTQTECDSSAKIPQPPIRPIDSSEGQSVKTGKSEGDQNEANHAEPPTGTGALGDNAKSTTAESRAIGSESTTDAPDGSAESEGGQVNAKPTIILVEAGKKSPVAESGGTSEVENNTKTKGAPDACTQSQLNSRAEGVPPPLPLGRSASVVNDTENKADSETESRMDNVSTRPNPASQAGSVPPTKPPILSTEEEPSSLAVSPKVASMTGIDTVDEAIDEAIDEAVDEAVNKSKSSGDSAGERIEAAGQRLEQASDETSTAAPRPAETEKSTSAEHPSRGIEELKSKSKSIPALQAQDNDGAIAKVPNVPTDPNFFERETPPIEAPTSNQGSAIEKAKLGDDVSAPPMRRSDIQSTGPESEIILIPTSQDGEGVSTTSNGARKENIEKVDNNAVRAIGAEKSESKSNSAPGLDTDLKQSLSQLDDLLAFEDGDEDEEEEDDEEEESKVDASVAYDGDETPKRSGSSPTFSVHDNSEVKGKMPLQPTFGVSTHDKREASESDIRNAQRAAEDAINCRLDSPGGQSIKRALPNGSLGATDRPNPLAKRCLSEELSVEGNEGEPKRKKSRLPVHGTQEKKKSPLASERQVDEDSSSGEEEVLDEGAANAINENQRSDDDAGRGFYADPNEDSHDDGQESSSLYKKDGQSSLQRPRKTHTRDGSHVSFSFETQEYFEDEPLPSQRQYFSPRRGNIGGIGHDYSDATLSPSRAVASPRRHYHSALSPIIKTPATPNHRWGASSFDHGLQPETPGAILAAIETPNPHRAANNDGPFVGLNVPLIADQRPDHGHGSATQDGLDVDVSTEQEDGDEEETEEEEEEEEKVEIPEVLKLASQKANDAAFDEMLRKSPENWTVGYGSDSEGELPSELPPSPVRKKKKQARPRSKKSSKKKKKSLPRLPPPPASLLRPSPKGTGARSGLASASFDESVVLAQRGADHNIYSQIDNFLSNELVSRGSFDERPRALNSMENANVDAKNEVGIGESSSEQHLPQQHKSPHIGSSSSRNGHGGHGDLRAGAASFRTGDKVYARFNKDGGWYPATVQSVIVSPHTEEKLFSVLFDDGETASHLPRACLCSLQDYHGQQACESNYRRALSRRDTNQGPERRILRESKARIRIGHINGVSEGHCYSRRSLFMAGAHQSDSHWINGDAHQGCDSIILTKPRPSNNEDDCLAWLKCEAGPNNGGCALTTSLHKKNPIRVFRSSMQKDNQYAPPLTSDGFHSCRYDGLYYVARMFDSRGGEANQMPLRGDTRCTFLIRRLPPKQEEQRARESWGDDDMHAVPNAQEHLNDLGVHSLLQLIQRSRGQSDKTFQHRTPNAMRSPAFGNRSTIRSGSRSSRSRSGSRGGGPMRGLSFDPFAGITIRTDREISMDVRAGMGTARHANRGPNSTSHSGRLMSPRFNDVQDGVGSFDPSLPHSVLSGIGSHTPMSLGVLTPLNHSIMDNTSSAGENNTRGADAADASQQVASNTTNTATAGSSWMTARYYSDGEHAAERVAGHTVERTAEHDHAQNQEKQREEDDEDEKMHEM